MRVWIVIGGEKHEGGDVCGVFSTFEKAMERARNCRAQAHRPYQLVEEHEDSARFEVGCDFLSVEPYEVDE